MINNDPLYNVVYTATTSEDTAKDKSDKIAIAEAFKITINTAIHDALIKYDAINDADKKMEFLKRYEVKKNKNWIKCIKKIDLNELKSKSWIILRF